MRRVLIITSSYTPAMIADMHRTRLLAWELPKLGWEVEILCPSESFQILDYLDEDSVEFFRPDVPVHWAVEGWSRVLRMLGFGSIGWRAIGPMLMVGRKLLQRKHFDLIFISTAKFPLFLLGPAFRKWFGVPFVLDLHDPCFRDEAAGPGMTRSSLKHAISHRLAKCIEENSLPAAAGLVSVSPIYIDVMRRRYAIKHPAWTKSENCAVVPFAARLEDLVEAGRGTPSSHRSAEQRARVVYVGAGGPIMARSFSLLCRSLSRLRVSNPALLEDVRIELYGTMLEWRPGDPQHLAQIAQECGVGDLVSEYPSRTTYRRSLELLLEGDAALILGVDETGYMPSKLFSYALSGKPLLASLRRDGPAFAEFKNKPPLGHALWFGQNDEMATSDASEIVRLFLEDVVAKRRFDRTAVLESNLAPAMASQHVALFEACLQHATARTSQKVMRAEKQAVGSSSAPSR